MINKTIATRSIIYQKIARQRDKKEKLTKQRP